MRQPLVMFFMIFYDFFVYDLNFDSKIRKFRTRKRQFFELTPSLRCRKSGLCLKSKWSLEIACFEAGLGVKKWHFWRGVDVFQNSKMSLEIACFEAGLGVKKWPFWRGVRTFLKFKIEP